MLDRLTLHRVTGSIEGAPRDLDAIAPAGLGSAGTARQLGSTAARTRD